MRYIIVDGLPYLLAAGKTYGVRWDEKGYTVGAEVTLASVPDVTFSELSILAKCAGHLDSIAAAPKAAAGRKKKSGSAVKSDDPDNGGTA